jgi:hypothetical protein
MRPTNVVSLRLNRRDRVISHRGIAFTIAARLFAPPETSVKKPRL